MSRPVVIVMGVTCSGKSTTGKALAKAMDVEFFDGDDFHPQSNIEKMKRGAPLNDKDRQPWLERLGDLAKSKQTDGAVIACSALKNHYRHTLQSHEGVYFAYLHATRDEIASRLAQRKGHFMPPSLLSSQFDTLEEPADCLRVEASWNTDKQVSHILSLLP